MPPYLALLLWGVLLVALFRFDSRSVPATSYALWVPLVEFFIVGSRLPSQWLDIAHIGTGAQMAVEEGNAFDRTVYLVLIVLSLGILIYRSFPWATFFGRNMALVVFLLFALASVTWSDYPFVAFKRWVRDLAYYTTVLVVLSDIRPFDALRALLRRTCFLLIPLSIVVIKYFPAMGRQYDVWTGVPMYVGIATSKNMLGVACLFSGIFFAWDTATCWTARREARVKQAIVVNLAFLAMTLWLLARSRSATSTICLLLTAGVLALARSRWVRRRRRLLLTSIPLALATYGLVSFALGPDINSAVAAIFGRDPTLTGRTLIWRTLLQYSGNPVVGTGYESFWLGPRLQKIWLVHGTINEAHNGYLQIYLNLGLVGLGLLFGLLVAAYRKVWRMTTAGHSLGSLALTIWTVLVAYNVTEAAFPAGLLWLMFLSGILFVPDRIAAAEPGRFEAPESVEASGWIPRTAWATARISPQRGAWTRSAYAQTRSQ